MGCGNRATGEANSLVNECPLVNFWVQVKYFFMFTQFYRKLEPGTRPPLGPNSFIFMQFSAKKLPNIRLAHSPPRLVCEILDPPLLTSCFEMATLADLRGVPGTPPSPLGVQILSISCSSWAKIGQIITFGVGAPTSGKSILLGDGRSMVIIT